jgi:hypothetical protein
MATARRIQAAWTGAGGPRTRVGDTTLARWSEVRHLTARERPPHGTPRRRLATVLIGAGALLIGAAALGVTGCSPAASAGAAGTSCGNTRTGVNVPVTIDVAKGPVNCAAALRVEQGYAADVRNGDLKGNGGGAPVAVDGWTCESYPTPQVLRTRDASECHTANAEVLAVLSVSSASSPASASTGS